MAGPQSVAVQSMKEVCRGVGIEGLFKEKSWGDGWRDVGGEWFGVVGFRETSCAINQEPMKTRCTTFLYVAARERKQYLAV